MNVSLIDFFILLNYTLEIGNNGNSIQQVFENINLKESKSTPTGNNNDKKKYNLESLMKLSNSIFDKVNKQSYKLDNMLIPTYLKSDNYLKNMNSL